MVYTEAWSPDKNNNERFQNLISDPDNVLLVTDSDNMIHTLHSFKVVRGTFLCPTSKLMCLLGSEEDDDDGDNNDKDGVEDAEDAVPPRQPQCPGGRVKSLVSPVHPHVTLRPPPPGRGSVAVIEGRRGWGGGLAFRE